LVLKELPDCMKQIIFYSKIIIRLENFVQNSTNTSYSYTLTYEAFAQCIIEFLKYFKQKLNIVGEYFIKKVTKFTLVDFITKLKDPYFMIFDIFDQFLKIILKNENREPHIKSTSLLDIIHKYLIDSYSLHKDANIISKFLMWLFIRTIKPYLTLLNSFIQEGDSEIIKYTKYELGFKRNFNISIYDPQFWTHGYEIDNKESFSKFISIILTSAYKISKHMEIVKLLGNYTCESNIYDCFIENILIACPYLVKTKVNTFHINHQIIEEQHTLLDINFKQLNNFSKINSITDISSKMNVEINSIEILMNDYFNNSSQNESIISLNIEKNIQDILNNSLLKNVEWSSSILIEKLFNKYQMFKFFDFLQSYYFFKSNEIMFLFGKSLFSLIKSNESYQEDAVLNSLFYSSSHSVFTTTALILKSPFSSNLVTFNYDDDKTNITPINDKKRQIHSIKLKIKVIWPLNIIVQPHNLEAYNKIFLFIMQIKQAKYEICSLDLKDMDIKRYNNGMKSTNKIKLDEQLINRMFLIRFKLMNFLNSAHDLICNQVNNLLI
jgi:gamma-tubulin complex component 5